MRRVVLDHGGVGVTAGVGGVVPGAVVVDGPVHELEVLVGTIGVEIEEIGETELAEPDFDAALGKPGEERIGTAKLRNRVCAEGNDLVIDQAGDIGSFA